MSVEDSSTTGPLRVEEQHTKRAREMRRKTKVNSKHSS